MNVYITKLNGMFFQSTEQYAQHMTANIAHSIGIREMGIYRYHAAKESEEDRGRRLDGVIAGLCAGDLVICQFPTWNGLEFEQALVRHIKAYHGRIVIFIHDLEAVMSENRRDTLPDTIRLYNEAEVLIAPSYRMKQFLLEHGLRPGMRLIVQEIWDYPTRLSLSGTKTLKREIHFAGNPDRFPFVNTWNYEAVLNVYTDQACQGNQVRRMGWMMPDRLLMELSEGGFGLVWYANETWRQYLSVNNSLKLSTYLAAGIPVIVPKGISNQSMIEVNHLGIAVDTLEEAAQAVKDMTEPEYQEYLSAVSRFAPLLREGLFTKKCLLDAIHMLMRKDLYVYSESNAACAMPKGVFEFVCLREAWQGKLALSWIFCGEAEGYLVCDADSGNVVGEVLNGLEHYLLLENPPKEIRLIVKAYIRGVRGKLIIAESEAAYVSKPHPAKRLVSMVMPAYNAAEFIARSIDTVLAQSFMDFELIVVDDGSTDETSEIVAWYQERYPQVRKVYQPNAGQAIARNHGVKHASGEYTGFMDSDDMIRPDMIEKLYRSIVKNNCDIAMTSAYQIMKEGYQEIAAYPISEDTAISVNEFFEHYMKYAYPVVWNKLYRSSLVREHPIPKVTYEDSAWTPYILSYAETVCYINEHLYEYDRIIRNVTYIHTSRAKTAEKLYKDRRDYVMFFLENGNPQRKDVLKRLALGYVTGFVHSLSHPGFKQMQEEIKKL